MKLYLGTNYGHGASAAVIAENGELLFAVEEGKLIGVKDIGDFPIHALEAIKQEIHGEYAAWAEGWDIQRRLFFKGCMQTFKYGLRDPIYLKKRFFKEIKRYGKGIKYYRNPLFPLESNKIFFTGHHCAHAFSLLPWGLPSHSLIVVSDTTAEKESISLFYWTDNRMIHLISSYYPHSIGGIFHQMAYHLGFTGRTGPGKLMALSSLGEPVWYEKLKKICNIHDGIFEIDRKIYPIGRISNAWLYFSERQPDNAFNVEIQRCYNNFEAGKNLAASIQKLFTEVTIEIILQLMQIVHSRYGVDAQHIGLVGGAALNCQANGEIIRRITREGIVSVCISPWSDDAGTAIGAASWLAHLANPSIRFKKARPFLGPTISRRPTVLNKHIEQAAEALCKGEILALASGPLEFGPRALGGRCLLADARKLDIKDKLNRMKNRPYFMPFSPVVLSEDFGSFFTEEGSTNMAWTVRTKPHSKKVVPAAIHFSGESRVQVLKNNEPPLLSKLLKMYKDRTGIGLLLLTSLNGNNEAIPASFKQSLDIARRLECWGLLHDNGITKF